MSSRLTARGTASTRGGRLVGRVTRSGVAAEDRGSFFRVVSRADEGVREAELAGYGAVLVEAGAHVPLGELVLGGFESLDFLSDDHVAILEPRLGRVRVVYRPESSHNFLFATERCSSSCLMCSQPPRETGGEGEVEELLRIVELIPDQPKHLGITGGEPTLLLSGLIELVRALATRLPETHVTMLSNGRLYCYEEYVERLAAVDHPNFVTSIPLHGDCAADHDYVAQVRGAFDETIQGIYNAASHGLGVEIRVVLHRHIVPVLRRIVEFVYRNLPFVQHVALMGLENMGFAKARREDLFIDPIDYAAELEDAVRYCWNRRLPVSVYNLPLCVLPRTLWGFARQSISDYKTAFLAQCDACSVRAQCSGVFSSGVESTSRGIRAVRA